MVGMHTSGFDRLVKALDEYAGARPGLEVVIQSGSSSYQPTHAKDFAYKESLQEEIQRADLVVSHGSVGFFDAVKLGKRLIVVPRRSEFGEHIDDHQVGFAQIFSLRYGFPVVLDIADLGGMLDKVSQEPPPQAFPIGVATGLHSELSRFLATL